MKSISTLLKLLCLALVLFVTHGKSYGQCSLDLNCPITFESTVQCIDDVPSPASTESELVALGFTINAYCGSLDITSNDVSDGNTCPETITRTYTIFDDLNSNGIMDIGEEEVVCEETITVIDNTDPELTVPADIIVECDMIPTAFTEEVTLTTGLIAAYELDETNGTTVEDSYGSNNGTLVGGTVNQNGKIGTSYDFNSSSSEYISLPNANFNFERTDPFSISAWVYLDEMTADYVIFSKSLGLSDAFPLRGYKVWVEDNKVGVILRNTNPGNRIFVFSDTDISTTSWHHVTVTYDGSSDASGITIFIDGNETGSYTFNSNTLSASIQSNADTEIGHNYNIVGKSYFNGLIDQVAVWGREISQAEAMAVYNSGNGLAYLQWENSQIFATDNCDANIAINYDGETRTDGDCANSYSLIRTWTATDDCGNETSESQTITVNDNTAPELTVPADVTVECNAIPEVGTASATDNCDSNVTVNYDGETRTDGECANSYTLTRTWTVADVCGNEASESQTITVNDNTDPELTVPADITVECDMIPTAFTEEVTLTTGLIAAYELDETNGTTVEDSYGSNNGTLVGGTVNQNGKIGTSYDFNSSSSEYISLPNANFNFERTDPFSISAWVYLDEMTADYVIFSKSLGLSDAFPLRGYKVWVEDNKVGVMLRNTNPGNRIFVFSDTDISTTSWHHVTVTYDGSSDASGITIFIDGNETGSYTVNSNTLSASIQSNADTEIGHNYNIVGESYFNGLIDQVAVWERKLNETEALVLYNSGNGLPFLNWEDSQLKWEDFQIFTTDNCDTNVSISYDGETRTDGDCANSYTLNRTWTATDGCNNSTSVSQTVTVTDITIPELTVPADVVVECGDDTTPANTGYPTMIDNCDSNPTATFSDVTTSGSCEGNFTIERTWSAEDKCGNISSAIQTISVEDNTPPTIACGNHTVYLNSNGLYTLSPKDKNTIISYITDNCSDTKSIEISISPRSFTCTDIGEEINAVVTATDQCGNVATCQTAITVVDTILPEVTCNDITVYLDKNGDASITSDMIHEGSIDACGIDLFTLDKQQFDCNDIGQNTVVLTAEDSNENYGSCNSVVTVLDTIAPEVICNDITVYLDENGEASITSDLIDGGSSDVCGIETVSLDKQLFDCDDVGQHTVTLTVSDLSGNNSSCTSQVTIMDTISPSIILVTDVEVEADPGTCSTEISYPEIIFSDNCQATLTQVAGLGPEGMFPLGSTTETWVATDSDGNTSEELSFIVTIIPINSPPIFDDITDVEVPEDTESISVDVTGISYGTDCVEEDVTISASINSGNDLVMLDEVIYTTGSTSAQIYLNIIPDMNGTAEVSVTIEDEAGDTTIKTFLVNVTPINDAPFLVAPKADSSVNASYELEIPISSVLGEYFDDIDGNPLTITPKIEDSIALPAWIEMDGETLVFKPTIADTGCVNIIIEASDGEAVATDTFAICVEGYPTLIDDLGSGRFEVLLYPNPTSGRVNIDMKSPNLRDIKLSVISVTGQRILLKQLNIYDRITFDLSDKASGMYFVELDFGDRIVTKKLIVDKD